MQAYTPESPQLHEPALDAPQVVAAVYHGNGNGTALLKDGTLYSLCEGGLQVEAMHVKSFCSDYVYDETNALQRLARELGAVGSSGFEAGFGGSVWALVRTDEAEAFAANWLRAYLEEFPEHSERASTLLTEPAESAHRV